MTKHPSHSPWQTFSVQANKKRWTKLTDTGVKRLEGKRDVWVGALRAHYCIVVRDMRQTIDRFFLRTQPGQHGPGAERDVVTARTTG